MATRSAPADSSSKGTEPRDERLVGGALQDVGEAVYAA